MKIKKARLRDIPIILEAHKQISLPIKDFGWDEEWWIEESIRFGNFFTINNHAFMSLEEDNSDTLEITTIVVCPEYHGLGYGKQLVNYAIKRAKRKGYSKLVVGSYTNYNVKDFYINCGFELLKIRRCYKKYKYYDFAMKL
jgi:GNAT superfamily N-acetyltransferase